jgi:hypothetical protein
VFENRVFKRIFGLKKNEVSGEDGKMRSFIIVHFARCNYNDKVKEMRWARHTE